LFNKGAALDNRGNYSEAIQYYDKVLAIYPKNFGALNNKGIALENLGNHSEAIQYYDKVLAIDPRNFVLSFYFTV
jgi:tetratricopeptide (TPR) repeat protein